jgi:RND family efflux transporter MFP subunit
VNHTKLAVAVAAAAAALALSPAARADAAVPGSPLRVHVVEASSAGRGRWLAANVRAVRRARVATRLSATVKAVHVQEGARVREGQLLVSLTDPDVRAAVDAAEVALASATAHERRITELARERAATPSELEGAQAQRAQARAAVAAARASLTHTELRAPFAGVIQARRVEPGDLVGPGQPLVELEGDALELEASLSEDEATGLATGQRLRFRAGDRDATAVITSLTPGGDALSHRRGLRARVVGAPAGLRSGTFARLEVPSAGAAPAAAWVPRSAVVVRGDLTGVFVAAAGRAELRWIAVGEPVGDHVPVRAGLAPADRVIDAPGALRDGQEIEVVHGN